MEQGVEGRGQGAWSRGLRAGGMEQGVEGRGRGQGAEG